MPRRGVRFGSFAEARDYWWSRVLDVARWALIVLLLAGFFVAMLTVMGTWDRIKHPVINPSPTTCPTCRG